MKRIFYTGLLLTLCLVFKAQDQIKLKSGDVIKCRVTKMAAGKVLYIKTGSGKKVEKAFPKGEVEYIKYGSGKIVFMEGNKMKKPVSKKVVKKK